MFGKYNIDDLYLTYVNVFYIKKTGEEVYISSTTTISKKINGNKYINLKNNEPLPNSKYPYVNKIAYLEPLGNYYTQDGKRKGVSKEQAIDSIKKYYSKFYEKCKKEGKVLTLTRK